MASALSPLLTPGMRVLCRDAEWLVTRVQSLDLATGSQIAFCTGADEMVRGHDAAFVTDLDAVVPIDLRETRLVRDSSHGFQRAKLFLEAQLRQMQLTAAHPAIYGIGAFRPLPFQMKAVEKAIVQMRPRLLLADAVGLGKTIQVGMILAELIRRGRADRPFSTTVRSGTNLGHGTMENVGKRAQAVAAGSRLTFGTIAINRC
jgi:hypothetical protein